MRVSWFYLERFRRYLVDRQNLLLDSAFFVNETTYPDGTRYEPFGVSSGCPRSK